MFSKSLAKEENKAKKLGSEKGRGYSSLSDLTSEAEHFLIQHCKYKKGQPKFQKGRTNLKANMHSTVTCHCNCGDAVRKMISGFDKKLVNRQSSLDKMAKSMDRHNVPTVTEKEQIVLDYDRMVEEYGRKYRLHDKILPHSAIQ